MSEYLHNEVHPLLVVFFVYIILSFLLAFQGKGKKIGFSKTLIISLLLTPITGLFIVMTSQRKYAKRVRPKNGKIEL